MSTFDERSEVASANRVQERRREAPYVPVLGRSNSDTSFDALSVTGAMFGDRGISMPFDPLVGSADREQAEWGFLLGGGLHAQKNTRYSAIAVLTAFNPTLHRVQRAYQGTIERHGIPPGKRTPIIARAFEHARSTAEFDDAASVARLTVYHNPYAANPLSMEAFGGPHDQQWGAVEGPAGEIVYTLIAEGRWAKELPRSSLE